MVVPSSYTQFWGSNRPNTITSVLSASTKVLSPKSGSQALQQV